MSKMAKLYQQYIQAKDISRDQILILKFSRKFYIFGDDALLAYENSDLPIERNFIGKNHAVACITINQSDFDAACQTLVSNGKTVRVVDIVQNDKSNVLSVSGSQIFE